MSEEVDNLLRIRGIPILQQIEEELNLSFRIHYS